MKPPKIPKRLPRPKPPTQAEREYMRLLNAYAERYAELLRPKLLDLIPTLKKTAAAELPRANARFDSSIERVLRVLFEQVGRQLHVEYPDSTLSRWAWAMVGNVNSTAKRNVTKVAEKVGLEIQPLMRDRELTPYFRNVVEENVGLIKSIPAGRLVAFKNQLVAQITRDAPQDQIREMVQAHFNSNYDSARRIARDQTNKLNGAVSKYRQEQIGGKRYRWRGAGDSRERPDHKRLEGQTFSWSSPPITNRSTGARNHPGQDIECRCYAEMVLEDVV